MVALGVVFGGLFVVGVSPLRPAPKSDAWQLLPSPRWDHSCLTYGQSGDVERDAAVAAGFARWLAAADGSALRSCGAVPMGEADLRYRVVPAGVFVGDESGVANAFADVAKGGYPQTMSHCDMLFTASGIANGWVVSHEFGHCLGLMHSRDAASVMYPTQTTDNGSVPSADDVTALRAAFPSQLRQRLAINYWLLSLSKGGS